MASSRWKRFAFFDRKNIVLPSLVLSELLYNSNSNSSMVGGNNTNSSSSNHNNGLYSNTAGRRKEDVCMVMEVSSSSSESTNKMGVWVYLSSRNTYQIHVMDMSHTCHGEDDDTTTINQTRMLVPG